MWSWGAEETSVTPPALPVGCLDGDLVHTGFVVLAPASLPAPEPLAQIQTSFFWVWFPSPAPDTHVFVELGTRTLQLTPLASLETCTPVYR